MPRQRELRDAVLNDSMVSFNARPQSRQGRERTREPTKPRASMMFNDLVRLQRRSHFVIDASELEPADEENQLINTANDKKDDPTFRIGSQLPGTFEEMQNRMRLEGVGGIDSPELTAEQILDDSVSVEDTEDSVFGSMFDRREETNKEQQKLEILNVTQLDIQKAKQKQQQKQLKYHHQQQQQRQQQQQLLQQQQQQLERQQLELQQQLQKQQQQKRRSRSCCLLRLCCGRGGDSSEGSAEEMPAKKPKLAAEIFDSENPLSSSPDSPKQHQLDDKKHTVEAYILLQSVRANKLYESNDTVNGENLKLAIQTHSDELNRQLLLHLWANRYLHQLAESVVEEIKTGRVKLTSESYALLTGCQPSDGSNEKDDDDDDDDDVTDLPKDWRRRSFVSSTEETDKEVEEAVTAAASGAQEEAPEASKSYQRHRFRMAPHLTDLEALDLINAGSVIDITGRQSLESLVSLPTTKFGIKKE